MPLAQTVLEKIEVNMLTGQTRVQWRNQIVADNGVVMVSDPTVLTLDPPRIAPDGVTPIPATDRAQALVAVDAQMTALGYPATAPSDKGVVAAHDTARPTFTPVKIKGLANV